MSAKDRTDDAFADRMNACIRNDNASSKQAANLRAFWGDQPREHPLFTRVLAQLTHAQLEGIAAYGREHVLERRDAQDVDDVYRGLWLLWASGEAREPAGKSTPRKWAKHQPPYEVKKDHAWFQGAVAAFLALTEHESLMTAA
jgi:hypothetical protein